MLHLAADRQSWAAGIVSREHVGQTVTSTRHASAHPMPDVQYFPPGVDRDIYRAWLALGEYIADRTVREGTSDV